MCRVELCCLFMSHCSHEMEVRRTAYCITRVREGPIKVLLVDVCMLVMMIKDKDIKELIDLFRIHPVKVEWKNEKISSDTLN